MNKKQKSEQMKKVAEARWGNRFSILAQLSKYVSEEFFKDLSKKQGKKDKWPTTYLVKLLKGYKHD